MLRHRYTRPMMAGTNSLASSAPQGAGDRHGIMPFFEPYNDAAALLRKVQRIN